MIKLLSFWNIKDEVHQIYSSAWSIGNNYVLKIYDNLASLTKNLIITKTLNEFGIPVAAPVLTKDGLEFIESSDKYYLMMKKLPGTHIKDIYQSNYNKIANEIGKIVARLHSAFLNCEEKIDIADNSLLDEMNGWIHKTLEKNEYRFITKEDFKTSLAELSQCYDKLPKQLIHRDIHLQNLLFENDTLSGYIDFDLSQKNTRVFDISYFLIGLLIDHEKNAEDVDAWYCIVSEFVKGYEETNTLLDIEKASIPCLMKNIELLFVAYFLSIGNEAFAKGAADLFYFVKNNELQLKRTLEI